MLRETESPTQEIILSESTPLPKSRIYEEQDFKGLYEEEYRSHQETKRELQIARDRTQYLESRIEKLEADLAYVRKLFFSRKTEQTASLDARDGLR